MYSDEVTSERSLKMVLMQNLWQEVTSKTYWLNFTNNRQVKSYSKRRKYSLYSIFNKLLTKIVFSGMWKKYLDNSLIKCLKFLNSLVSQTSRSALVVENYFTLSSQHVKFGKERKPICLYCTSELLLFSISVFHWTLMSDDKILIGRPGMWLNVCEFITNFYLLILLQNPTISHQ